MEIERHDEIPQGLGEESRGRIKSPHRMRYEAEVSYLKKQNGSLEEIRQKLGLSRRKICQLLLVDPSAWTRWTSQKGEAPPHIYRSLDWYISIMDTSPEYRRISERFSQWLSHEKDHEGRLRSIEASLHTKGEARLEWRDFLVPILACCAGALLAYFSSRLGS